MYSPSDIRGLKCWLKPRNQPTANYGDPVFLWQNEGPEGAAHDFFWGEELVPPTYELGANLTPCLGFNGNSMFEGPDGNLILGTAAKAVFVTFELDDLTGTQTIFSDASNRIWLKVMTVAGPPDNIVAPRLRAYNDFSGGGSDQVESKILTPGVHVGLWQHFGQVLRVGLDDPFPDETNGTGVTLGLSTMLLGCNSALGELFKGKIHSFITYNIGMSEREVSKVMSFARNDALGCGHPIGQLRDTLSRRMVGNERSRIFVPMDVTLEFLDYNLLEPHFLSHGQVPDVTGRGAGLGRTERRPMNLFIQQETIGQHRLSILGADREEVGHMYRESGPALQPADSQHDGVAQSGYGVRRIYNHATKLYCPNQHGTIMEVRAGQEPGHPDGLFMDPESFNYIPDSSAIRGLLGGTVTGDGVNGSDVVLVEHDDVDAPSLFGIRLDSTNQPEQITEQHWEFLAGNPHAADLVRTWDPSVSEEPIVEGQWLCFSFYHLDLLKAVAWAIENEDGEFINDATGQWEASQVNNPTPLVTGLFPLRSRSNPFQWQGTTGFATLHLIYENGNTPDGAECQVFHVQLEPLTFPTQPWPQDNDYAGHRGACEMMIVESGEYSIAGSGVHFFHEPVATVAFVYKAPHSMADLFSGEYIVPLLDVEFENTEDGPTDNYWRCRIMASGQLRTEFVMRNGGDERIAFQDTTMIERDTETPIIIRLTSEEDGELGLLPNTMDIFVGGVKGQSFSVQVGDRPTPSLAPRVIPNTFGGVFKDIQSDYRAWPDAKCTTWRVSAS